MAFDTIILFIFGTIAGSFINALAFRHNTGKSMWGRSACTSCGRTVSSGDLIPVLSYIFLRGRCRQCKATISLQYPLIEVLAGLISVTAYFTAPSLSNFFFSFFFFMLLLFISLYDVRHTIVPDVFVYSAGLVALLFHMVEGGHINFLPLPSILAGFLLALPLFLIWFFSSGRAMGLGDSKLMCAVGIFLGLQTGMVALLFSFWLGAIVGVLLLILSARKGNLRGTMKSEVPFGPFIALGAFCAYFFHVTFTTLLKLFVFF